MALLGAGLWQRPNHRGPVVCELADARATTDLQRVNSALRRAAVFATAATRKAVCVQLVAALTHLHKIARAVYRDIKPANILCDLPATEPGAGGTRDGGAVPEVRVRPADLARRGAWGRMRRAAAAPGKGPCGVYMRSMIARVVGGCWRL